MKIGGSRDRREKDSPVGGPHYANHPPAVNHAASLEKDLQPELDAPRNVALAACFSEVGVT